MREEIINPQPKEQEVRENVWVVQYYTSYTFSILKDPVGGEDWDEEVADRASNLTLDDGWGIENDQGSKYYQLHLPESEIEMVDTREGFMNFLRKMENEVS